MPSEILVSIFLFCPFPPYFRQLEHQIYTWCFFALCLDQCPLSSSVFACIEFRDFASIEFRDFASILTLSFAFVQLDVGVVASKSSSNENSGSLPVFRSGSCAERGPKQNMEDEHVCVDNLVEHLGETPDFPAPGAFYGVSVSPSYLYLLLLLRLKNG